MKILLAISFTFFLCVNTHAQNKVLTYTDSLLVFHVNLDSSKSGGYSNCNVKSVTVTEKNKTDPTQIIQTDDNIISCDWLKHDFFVVEDMNFDGHKDFRLLQSLSPGGNATYAYWLYNTTTKAFAQNGAYEDSLATVKFDQEKKLIHSYWSGGTEYGSEVYKILKGKLVLIERETVMPEESGTTYYIRTVRQLVGGVMKVTSKDRISEEEFQKRQQ